MRISFLYFLLLTVLLSFGSNFQAVAAKGKRYSVKVYGMDKKISRGILQSADEKGIYLVRKTGTVPAFIAATDIKQIELRRLGKSGTGTAIGFGTGLAASVAAMGLLHSTDNTENVLHAVGGGVFTFLTTAIGGSIGSRYDESILINGRNEDYLQTLSRLQGFTPKSVK